MKGTQRLSFMFGIMERRWKITYRMWTLRSLVIIVAHGRKGITPPSEMELPYLRAEPRRTNDDS